MVGNVNGGLKQTELEGGSFFFIVIEIQEAVRFLYALIPLGSVYLLDNVGAMNNLGDIAKKGCVGGGDITGTLTEDRTESSSLKQFLHYVKSRMELHIREQT